MRIQMKVVALRDGRDVGGNVVTCTYAYKYEFIQIENHVFALPHPIYFPSPNSISCHHIDSTKLKS